MIQAFARCACVRRLSTAIVLAVVTTTAPVFASAQSAARSPQQKSARAAAAPSRTVAFDSASMLREARAILAELVSFNTTASTGSTGPATRALAARFIAAGFPAADVILLGPNARAQNIVVRWRGRTPGKPVLFSAHLDVVEAPRLEWSSDPFKLTERDGYLYGRGVLDDKGPAASIIAAFIALKRSGLAPQRDIVLALTAGEESGTDNGVQWLIEHRRSLVDAEYVLNLDAGGADLELDHPLVYGLQSSEKQYLDLELVARGPGGHSSVPPVASPVDHIARALTRLADVQFKVQVDPVVRAYLAKRAPLRGGDVGKAMAALAEDASNPAALSTLLPDRWFNAMLRTTCIATMLHGGSAPNAIAQEIVATVNCRLLPADSQEYVVRTLAEAIADSSIVIRVLNPAIASPASIPTPEILDMVTRVVGVRFPGLPVVPYMETGATDGLWFRNVGIPVFGVSGMYVVPADLDRMHGRDERVSLGAFADLVSHSERLVREVAKAR